MGDGDLDDREAELERTAEEHEAYSRHAVAFAVGFGFALLGAVLFGISRWLTAAGLVLAGLAWMHSGQIAWSSGVHMFGGMRLGGFGQFMLTRRSQSGARVVAVVLVVLGMSSVGAALGALV